MPTFITEPAGVDAALVQTVAAIVGVPAGVTVVSDERKTFHRYVCADRSTHRIATVTFSNVFDAVEIDPGLDRFAIGRAVQVHANRMLDPSTRRVLDLNDVPGAGSRRLLAADEHARSGTRLCALARGDLILVASANFLRDELAANHSVVHTSPSVFAARIPAWSSYLDDYVTAVGGLPPVIVGRFAGPSAIAAFCAALSKEARLPGTTFDLSAVALIESMARHADWAVVLNQGDKGYEDAVIAVCADEVELLDAMREALEVRTVIGF
jgi:hypothetical protein